MNIDQSTNSLLSVWTSYDISNFPILNFATIVFRVGSLHTQLWVTRCVRYHGLPRNMWISPDCFSSVTPSRSSVFFRPSPSSALLPAQNLIVPMICSSPPTWLCCRNGTHGMALPSCPLIGFRGSPQIYLPFLSTAFDARGKGGKDHNTNKGWTGLMGEEDTVFSHGILQLCIYERRTLGFSPPLPFLTRQPWQGIIPKDFLGLSGSQHITLRPVARLICIRFILRFTPLHQWINSDSWLGPRGRSVIFAEESNFLWNTNIL